MKPTQGVTESVAVTVTPPETAVRVTFCLVPTEKCFTVKLTELDPVAIFTLEGTLATFGLELLKLTTTPPVGSGPVKVTWPVTTLEELP